MPQGEFDEQRFEVTEAELSIMLEAVGKPLLLDGMRFEVVIRNREGYPETRKPKVPVLN